MNQSKAQAEEIVAPELSLYPPPTEDATYLQDKGIYYLLGDLEPYQATLLHQSILRKNLDPTWPTSSPITIIINSSGGELVGATWPLIDLISFIRLPVHTLAIGECSSGAALILCSGTKGLRTACPNASIMFHQLSAGTEDKIGGIRSWLSSVEMEHRKMIRLLTRNSNYKSGRVVEKKLLSSEDAWLTPEEALRHGLIDRILTKNDVW